MSTITTRAGKGSALTHNELDANFKTAAQTKAGAYTIAESDNRDTIEYSGAGAESFTMPDTATVVAAADTGDFEVTIKHVGAGVLTVTCTTGTDTIDGSTSDFTLDPNDVITLKSIQAGTGYNITSGATLNGVTRTNTATLSNKTLVAPALGTPASGVMTNVTGTASGLTAGIANDVASGIIDYADLNSWYSTLGAVGTYAWLGETTTTDTAAGATRAGSTLRYAGNYASSYSTDTTGGGTVGVGNGGTPSGTWKAMGRAFSNTSFYPATLWLRIS